MNKISKNEKIGRGVQAQEVERYIGRRDNPISAANKCVSCQSSSVDLDYVTLKNPNPYIGHFLLICSDCVQAANNALGFVPHRRAKKALSDVDSIFKELKSEKEKVKKLKEENKALLKNIFSETEAGEED